MESTRASRLLIVSNRLPVSFKVQEHRVEVVPSAGGLATGLRTPHERSGGLWFGWPGDARELRQEQREDLDAQLASMRVVPIHLSGAEVDRYYFGFSNSILWPLFHYLLDRMPLDSTDWEDYRSVNQRIADLVSSHYQEGDLVWVHDYHLMLVPQMIREKRPAAKIGFFLHIPFPSSEVFRILPRRAEILRGLLGADLIGFHTQSYLRHFSMSLLRILGLEADIDRLRHEGREVRLGAYPMGIDAENFEALARDPKVQAEAESLRAESGGARIILCVDRLDYTKGIARRLLALERLLEREPEMRGEVRLIQVAVPSRTEVPAYSGFKRQIDELVGRINGKFGTARYVPIHYLNRGFTHEELAALYLAAEVMAVTPLRDGLNLVAKEYLACQVDLDGVLVLSEFAGSASELLEALVVNPYDVDGMAQAFSRGLQMGREERTARLRPMRERVRAFDVHRWAGSFMEDLECASPETARAPSRPSSAEALSDLKRRIRAAGRLVLFLDYDGTLCPLVPYPDQAVPDADLTRLLAGLAGRADTAAHLVSGRERSTLESWFGQLASLALHAEHGLWSRGAGAREWVQNVPVSTDWKSRVRPILEGLVKRTPGTFIEEKSAGIAWHYRCAEPESGTYQARELRLLLIDLLSNTPVEVLAGNKVVEVRAQGIHKGGIVSRVLESEDPAALALAIGDDRTDEAMFAALPAGSVAVHVGPGESQAAFRLSDTNAARALLSSLLSSPGA